ncbi:dethiobiotin synthase [bacterium]|nr:dethiobiotin synthase [bacterium]
MKSLFITATGTDVGKTYISALLVKKMRENGLNCGYFKPVLSGAKMDKNGDFIPEDCKFVIEKSGLKNEPMDCLSYCFQEAVSPHLASSRKGVKIEIEKIIEDYNNYSQNFDYVLVEGAGGITCPLSVDGEKIVLLNDLVSKMKLSVLLVADAGLGTINSVLTSVDYIKSKHIDVVGIVLNNYDEQNFMHIDNKIMVEKLTNLPVVATISTGCEDIEIIKEDLERLFQEV